jgi:drug/metabolite transporter (DMT)-like permease
MSTFDSNNTGSNDTGSAPTTARSTHTSVSSRFRIPTVVQFALTALAWGASFLFIKIGLEGLSPGQVVLARLGCGSLTLLLICAITRQAMPRDRRTWLHLFLTAIMLCVVPFLLYSWAEQHISSGLASIYNATTPLMTTLFAMVALRSEPLTRARATGLLLGFVGVLVVLGPWRGLGQAGLMGQLACLGATACYGMGFIYMRRFITPLGLPALSVACGQVSLGALVMLLLTPAIATGPVTLTWQVVVSMILLGAVVESARGIALSTCVTLMIAEDERARVNGLVGMVNGLGFAVTSVFSGLAIGQLGMGWTLVIAVASPPCRWCT